MPLVLLAFLVCQSTHDPDEPDPFAGLAERDQSAYRLTASGFFTDASHPLRPGDFRRLSVTLRLAIDPQLGEAAIRVGVEQSGETQVDRYYVRRGRLFQVSEMGDETLAASLGDLSAATVAALHPAIVANAMRERRENVRPDLDAGDDAFLFAWNDELWSVVVDSATGRVMQLTRKVQSELFGDGTEEVRYEEWPADGGGQRPGRVVVSARGRELARLEFTAAVAGIVAQTPIPAGDRRRDRARAVAADEIVLAQVAPHLFTIDLESLDTRVMVAEFADHLVVLEGAYGSRVVDLIAERVRERLHKPVRFFAFSHLHGQYVGGTRSWVHEGATVIVPPGTVPLVEAMVNARHDLRPDALARDPRPLQIETVKERRRLEDETNALEILNVDSAHTDEYFLFYFPRQKVLMTGDLLFYKPGQPLSGRSLKVCDTVDRLRLDVERCYVTWPLSGHGTKNIVTGAELRAACEQAH